MIRIGVFVAAVVMMAQLCTAAFVVDFDTPFQPVRPPAGTKGAIGGDICPPLMENSSGWANVDMRFSRLVDGAFKGKASQRVEVTAVREGRAQAWVMLPAMEPGRYARLKVAARAPASGGVDVSIRMQGLPYTSLWDKHLSLSPEWRVYDVLIPALSYRSGTTYALMLYFGMGVTDIGAISLEAIDVDKLGADAPVKKGNLLPTSSFVVALPSPWSLGSGPIGCGAMVDASVLGPTGVPALKLTPGFAAYNMPMFDQVALVSPPLDLNQCRPHTLSLYLKGSVPRQRIKVQLAGPNGPSDGRDLTAGTDWGRQSATLKLPYIVDGFVVLRIESDKTFWLDGLQLEEAQTVSEFHRARAVELQVKASRAFGVYSGDEPMRVTYGVVGQVPAGTMLEGNLVDPYGRKQAIGPVACKAGNGAAAELELPPHAKMQYGTFVAENPIFNPHGNHGNLVSTRKGTRDVEAIGNGYAA